MDNRSPASYPRRILLAVTGLSPQIVTETLYALAIAADPPFVPTEIHLITTSEGAERARLALLSDKLGWFHRLRHDYALPPIAFDTAHIHVLRDAAGQAMSDIRSPQDNLACADYITEQVRTLTAAPDTALHVSIAGGRKTMGFFLGYALSLFGRPQDRLSHVLVSEPFENTWAFFYPTPYENVIETADKKLADARDARVSLAEIPFVSLRHGLPTALLDGSTGFDAAVAAARASLGPARLELDLGTERREQPITIVEIQACPAGRHTLCSQHRTQRLVIARPQFIPAGVEPVGQPAVRGAGAAHARHHAPRTADRAAWGE